MQGDGEQFFNVAHRGWAATLYLIDMIRRPQSIIVCLWGLRFNFSPRFLFL